MGSLHLIHPPLELVRDLLLDLYVSTLIPVQIIVNLSAYCYLVCILLTDIIAFMIVRGGRLAEDLGVRSHSLINGKMCVSKFELTYLGGLP